MRLCCIQQGHGILVCSSRRSSASWPRVGPSLSSFPDTLLPRLSFPTSLSISTAERSGDFADTAPYIRFPIDPPLQLPQWGTPPDWCYPCNADSGTIIRVPTWSTLVRFPHGPPSSADPLLSGRPAFPLAPSAISFSYDFPLPAGPDAGKYGWVLSFGAGIVMSQSRMLEVARVVQPHDQLSYTGTGPGLSFMTGSWVDMLVFFVYVFPLVV